MRFDVVTAVEACYAPFLDDRRWLQGILASLAPLDRGRGCFAQALRDSPGAGPVIELSVESASMPPGALAWQARLVAERRLPADLYAGREPIAWLTGQAARAGCADDVRRLLAAEGIADALGMFAQEPGGRTIVVFLIVAPDGHPSPRTLHQLAQVAEHLAAATRLRAALRSLDDGVPEPILDSVPDPPGPPGAAEWNGGTMLADGVRRLERAPGTLQSSGREEALEVWQGLVAGTWSVVDQVDRGGTRRILARRNRPGSRDPTALTAHERSVAAFAALGYQNKLIGFALGLSPSAVTVHLRAAERKLKLSGRADLVRLLAPLVLPPSRAT